MDGFKELNIEDLKTPLGLAELNRMLKTLFDSSAGDGQTVKVYSGYGSPENSVVADKGSIYMRKDGGAGTSVYVKESGTGASGWAAK